MFKLCKSGLRGGSKSHGIVSMMVSVNEHDH